MNSTQAATPEEASSLYTWYAVALLTTAYVFSYLDRSILTLLVKPIRDDFGISDTQISLLHGFAFAIFYAGLGIPMGRLADRSHRVRLVTAGIGVWSIFTAACGLTRNFLELFLMRMLVGVGESILNPCAYSIITDTARRKHLSLALSIYTMGIYIGAGLALVLGGLVIRTIAEQPILNVPFIGDIASWKSAFFIVGIPGILLMLLVGKTLQEPARRGLMNPYQARHASLSDVVDFVRLNKRVLFFTFWDSASFS
jgi:MFS family permease